MRDLLFEGSIKGPRAVQPEITKRASERLSLLVANRTASLLQDAALTSLFHSYQVELFQNASDLFVARSAPVSYALLCASAGCSLLATEAHIIRKQWPLARIMVLGSAPQDLEDHLYDDTFPSEVSAITLQTAFDIRSVDLWDRSIGWNDRNAKPSRVPKKSDPTKAEPPDLLQPPLAEPRDSLQIKTGRRRSEPVQLPSSSYEPDA